MPVCDWPVITNSWVAIFRMANVCPTPLVSPDNPDTYNVEGCAPPCPNSFYSPEEWDFLNFMSTLWAIAGCAGGLFVFLTWSLSRTRRAEQFKIIYFAFCGTALSSTYLIAVVFGRDEVFCSDNSTPRDDGICVVQSFFAIFFGMAICIWWCRIAISTYTRVSGRFERGEALVNRYFNLVQLATWIVPLIVAVVPLANGRLGFSPGFQWCFITDRNDWALLGFYVPLGCVIGIGSYCMFLTLIAAYKHLTMASNNESRSQHEISLQTDISTGSLDLSQQQGGTGMLSSMSVFVSLARPALFLLIFLFICVVMFTMTVTNDARNDSYKRAVNDWVNCLMLEGVDACSAHPSSRPLLVLQHIHSAGSCGAGFWLFLLYGGARGNLRIWKDLASSIRTWLNRPMLDLPPLMGEDNASGWTNNSVMLFGGGASPPPSSLEASSDVVSRDSSVQNRSCWRFWPGCLAPMLLRLGVSPTDLFGGRVLEYEDNGGDVDDRYFFGGSSMGTYFGRRTVSSSDGSI